MKFRFMAISLLLLQAWLMFSTLGVTSPTVDEPLHIVRGYAFALRGEDRLRLRGPVLPNVLSGWALMLEPDLKLPLADDPIWLERDGTGLPETFMWANTAPPLRMIFLARLPMLFASLLLGALIFRWAAPRSGPWAALGALVLYAFCPNMLAHARVATTDVITALTFFASAYAFSEALRLKRWTGWVLSGLMLGLALASKFSAVILLPVMALQVAVIMWQTRSMPRAWYKPIGLLLATLGLAVVTVWGVYRFKIGPLDNSNLMVPAPSYWGEWLALNEYLAAPLPAYLFGQVSTQGWWYYYPVTFALKTPLPVLILLALAVVLLIVKRTWLKQVPIFLPPTLLLLTLLFSPHDLGYRYLLPMLPFIFVACADVFVVALRKRWMTVVVMVLIGWQILGTLRIYPYYFAFFNETVGDPDQGRYLLSDSNLDWGQDLAGLKDYVEQQHIADLNLSYFGNTPPSVYGLHTYALPPVRSAMREQGAWWLHRYYPPDPAPGVYAISVANLMGGLWNNQSDYAYFREREPDAVIGHTLYVYAVPSRGTPIDLSLAGLQLDQIDPVAYQQFKTNDVRPRWFDVTSSLIAAPDRTWLAIADDQLIAPELAPLFVDGQPVLRTATTGDQRSYALYYFDVSQRLLSAARRSEQTTTLGELPIKFGDTAELIGYQIHERATSLVLLTYWRVGDQVVTPLQMFVHVLGPDGSITAQQDRLDVPAFGWRAGDLIVQIHHIDLPANMTARSIALGLYNPDTQQRLPVVVNDREVDQRLILKQLP
ncbi:hypothetical protein TFLX_02849 [Thermoflexales bacterium]|nr:hypothetical protein TFLX_02849 [Thermoflexales bacterium]